MQRRKNEIGAALTFLLGLLGKEGIQYLKEEVSEWLVLEVNKTK